MLKISTKSQYGLRAMVYLAKAFGKNKICSLKEIAKKEGIPQDYLEKIVSKLRKKKLVKAKKGVKGGYLLAKNPLKVTIGEILESLEGKPKLVKCIEGFCQRSKICSAKFFWRKLNKSITSILKSVTLSDLIEKI